MSGTRTFFWIYPGIQPKHVFVLVALLLESFDQAFGAAVLVIVVLFHRLPKAGFTAPLVPAAYPADAPLVFLAGASFCFVAPTLARNSTSTRQESKGAICWADG